MKLSIMRKSMISVLSTVLLFGALSPLVSASSPNNRLTQPETNSTVQITPSPDVTNDGEITTYGVKSKGVLKVIELLNDGGAVLVNLAEDFNIIDSSTGKTLKNNSKKIGGFVSKLEGAADDIANATRTQLPRWLSDNTAIRSKGVAENIAIAVSWAIRGADILFF